MKRMAAALIALALLLSAGALAEERNFALNREEGSDIYSWDGARLTPPDTYFSIYSVTAGRTTPGDELFAAQDAAQPIPQGGDYAMPHYAILDAQGRQLTDFLYDSVDYDPDSDALVYTIDGKTGAMTRTLQELVPCKYDVVAPDGEGGFLLTASGDGDTPPVLHMVKGKAPRKTGTNARFYWGNQSEGLTGASGANGLYGFLNSQGKWAIEPRFEWAQSFVSGRAFARENGLTGIIDKAGRWVSKPSASDDRGMLPDGSVAILMRGTRAYFIRTSDGKQLFSTQLTQDGILSTGIAKSMISVTDKGKSKLLDASGKTLLTLDDRYTFDLWSEQPDDRLLVTSVNDAKLLSLDGSAVYECQGLSFLDTVDGRTLYASSRFKTRMIQYDGYGPSEEPIYETCRYGIVDSDGKEILPMIYQMIYPLASGRYYAEDAKRWGVIDQTGKWIVSQSLYAQLMD